MTDLEAESLAIRVGVEYAAGNVKFASIGLSVGLLTLTTKKISKYTRIIFCSYHSFFNSLVAGEKASFLSTIGAVVLDDAHLRPVHLDLTLGLLAEAIEHRRCPRIVLLSADGPQQNPNVKSLASYFQAPALIEIKKPSYSVRMIVKNTLAGASAIADAAVKTCRDFIASSGNQKGDILCFLPSKDEVCC